MVPTSGLVFFRIVVRAEIVPDFLERCTLNVLSHFHLRLCLNSVASTPRAAVNTVLSETHMNTSWRLTRTWPEWPTTSLVR